jgi:hypothetical protein
MKRGTPDHPKTRALARDLNISLWGAVGLLEMLWHFTAQHAPDGGIGRYSDAEIAKGVAWGGQGVRLGSAWGRHGWVDPCICHRLRVHDWPDHADQTVRRYLLKHNKWFLPCYKISAGPDLTLVQTSPELVRDLNGTSNAVAVAVAFANGITEHPPAPPADAGARASVNSRGATREREIRAARDRLIAFASTSLGLRFDRPARRALFERLASGEPEAHIRAGYESVLSELQDDDSEENESDDE